MAGQVGQPRVAGHRHRSPAQRAPSRPGHPAHHQGHGGQRAQAQHQPVEGPAGRRLDQAGRADGEPPRRHIGRHHPDEGAGHPGQGWSGGGRHDRLGAGHAEGLAGAQVLDVGLDEPRDGLAGQEHGGHKGDGGEGDQAPGLEGDAALQLAIHGRQVPHVEIGSAGDPGQVASELGDGGLAPLEPQQAVDVVLVAGLGLIALDRAGIGLLESGRREHAAGRAGAVEEPGRADHAHDGGDHRRTVPGAAGPIHDLGFGGQLEHHVVAHPEVVVAHELARHHHLVGPVGIEHPAGVDDRLLDRAHGVGVARREVEHVVGQALEPQVVVDHEAGQGHDLGHALDAAPVEPGGVGQHGHRGRVGARLEPPDGALAASGAGHGSQHGAARQGDEQGQHGQRTGPVAQVDPQPGAGGPPPADRTGVIAPLVPLGRLGHRDRLLTASRPCPGRADQGAGPALLVVLAPPWGDVVPPI